MPLSRALLLKGLGGVTAAGAVGVGAYGATHPNKFADLFKSQNQINEEKAEKEKREEIIERVKNLLPEDCHLENRSFTGPTTFSKECSLDEDKFKKIKFFDGEGEVSVEGFEEGNTVSLTVSDKEENGIKVLFKNPSSNLIVSSGSKPKVTIRKEKETDFEEENGRLVKVVDQALKTKLEAVNEKLGTLGLTDESCKFDVTEKDESIECGLDGNKLKAIKFSNKGSAESLTVTGNVGDSLKIKVELGDNNDPSFSFSGLSENLTIYGDKSKGKIVIKNESKFKDVDGKLTKGTPDEALEKLNEQLGTVNAPLECRFDEAESDASVDCTITEAEFKALNFSNKGEGELTVKTWPNSGGVKLKAEKDKDNALSVSFTGLTSRINVFGDKGKIVLKNESKFKVVDGKLTKGASDADLKKFNEQLGKINAPLECRFDEAETNTSVECDISEDKFKALNFSNKGEGELTVKTWPAGGTVKLKAEKDSSSPTTMSVSFPGLSENLTVYGNKGKIVLKNSTETKLKVIDNKLTKGDSNADLKKFNEQLGKVKAPVECRFDESESDTTVECNVTPEDLQKMIFSKDQGNLTYSKGDNFQNMKLLLQVQKEMVEGETEAKVMNLTFKGYDKTVKLSRGGQEIVSFVKNTNPEFGIEEDDSVLVLKKDRKANSFIDLLSLKCTAIAGKTYEECTSTTKNISVGSGEEIGTLNISTNKFELYKDQEGFNQGYKFVFKGWGLKNNGTSICLEQNKSYEVKEKNNSLYLERKDPQ